MGGDQPTLPAKNRPRVHEPSHQQGRAPCNLSSGTRVPRALPEADAPGSGGDSSDFRGWGAAGAQSSRGNAPSPGHLHLPRPPPLGRPQPGLGWDSRGGRPSALSSPLELRTPGPLSPAACTWARRDGDAKRRTALETSRIPSLGTFFAAAARPPGATAPAHQR